MPALNFRLENISANSFTVAWNAAAGVQYYIERQGWGDERFTPMEGNYDRILHPKVAVPLGGNSYTTSGIYRNFYEIRLYEGNNTSYIARLLTRVDDGVIIIDDIPGVAKNILDSLACCTPMPIVTFQPNAGGCHNFDLPACSASNLFQYFVLYRRSGSSESWRIQRFKSGICNRVAIECFKYAGAGSASYNSSDTLELLIIPTKDELAFQNPPFGSLWHTSGQ